MSIKFAKKPLAVAVTAGLLGMAGLAQASSVGLGAVAAGAAAAPADYDGEITIAQERIDIGNYTLDLNNANTSGPNAGATEGRNIGFPIYFCTTIGLNPNDLITFAFSGATWNSTGAVLIVEEGDQPVLGAATDFDGDSMTSSVLEAASDFSAAVAGDSEVTVRVNQNLTLGSGTCMILATANSCPDAGSDGQIDDDSCSPQLLIDQSSSNDVTVSVTGIGGGSNIPALAAANTLANIEPQFGLEITTVANDTVDVTADPTRTQFVGVGTTSTAAYELSAGTDTSFTAPSDIIEDVIELAAGDIATLTLSSSTLGAVDTTTAAPMGTFIDTPSDVPTLPTAGTNSLFVTETGDLMEAGGVDLGTAPAANTVGASYNGTSLVIETDETAIDIREWEFDVEIAFEAEGETILGPETSHVWDQNGTILTFPFMTINEDIDPSRFVVTNSSDVEVAFTIEVLGPASTNNTVVATPVVGGTTSGNIPAQSSFAIQAADVLQDAGRGSRAAVRITVAADAAVISGAYQMVNPDSTQTVYVADKN